YLQWTQGKSVRAKHNEDKNKTCERSVLKAYSTYFSRSSMKFKALLCRPRPRVFSVGSGRTESSQIGRDASTAKNIGLPKTFLKKNFLGN
ncbi:MAG: hypothetical protein IKS15_04375, partial [Opitutales bacterium]|nr:hypothetical protein [Opitutales bacterium]